MSWETPVDRNSNGVKPSFDRRTFLGMAGAASVGTLFLVDACSGVGPSSPASGVKPTVGASTSNPTPVAAASSAKLQLPTYLPAQGTPKPDLPASEAGLQAGYLKYPKDLVKSVAQPPGLGGDVSLFTLLQGPPPPAVDQNPMWQAVNKQLNANMKMLNAPDTEYNDKVAITMAGGDLPDLFYLSLRLSIADLPTFLKRSYADLTPYLSGDAIKEYPNLAAFPTAAWAQSLLGGAIYSVPNVKPYFQQVWYVNQTRLDAIGATQPKNADDFKRLLTELTRPQENQWGISGLAPTYGLLIAGGTPQLAMFGAPPNWAVDSNGKFTKDIETEQFRAALGYVRDLYALGVFYPDPTLNNVTQKSNFVAGKYAVVSQGWASYPGDFWNTMARLTPPMKVRTLHPFSHDGGKPIFHQYPGRLGYTAIKTAPAERIKELLRILNYMAAPFGSQEDLLLTYGVKDLDFNFDAEGNPIPTPQGLADLQANFRGNVSPPKVLFNPYDADFVKVAYADEQAIVPVLVQDPSAGLFSATDTSKGGLLMQKVWDGIGEIVRGGSPLSSLDQLLKDWRAAGGDQMRLEYQQAYADSRKAA
jgi:putative aldouronate transport system substrate-binding protein